MKKRFLLLLPCLLLFLTGCGGGNNDLLAQVPAFPTGSWTGEFWGEGRYFVFLDNMDLEKTHAYAQELRESGFTADAAEQVDPYGVYRFEAKNSQGYAVELRWPMGPQQARLRLTAAPDTQETAPPDAGIEIPRQWDKRVELLLSRFPPCAGDPTDQTLVTPLAGTGNGKINIGYCVGYNTGKTLEDAQAMIQTAKDLGFTQEEPTTSSSKILLAYAAYNQEGFFFTISYLNSGRLGMTLYLPGVYDEHPSYRPWPG